MKLKNLVMLSAAVTAAVCLAAGRRPAPGLPSDFRDAPRDTPALDGLANSKAAKAAEAPPVSKAAPRPEALVVAAPVGPVPGLERSGDLPLPALGPDAAGVFRPAPGYTEGGSFAPAAPAPAAAPGALRVMQWNVSRGEKFGMLMQVIKKAAPDVLILSETDLYGKIAKGKVTAREIAAALGYSYFTAAEFGELREDRQGSSGNAIVSRYPLSGGRFVALPIMKAEGGYDWADDGGQPRTGQRNSISAYIEVPGQGGKKVRVNLVSLHTENKANAKVRLAQFETAEKALTLPGEPAILAGDLNTISIGEGGSFRKYLKKVALIDCSKGDDQGTHLLNMRLDWVILRPGAGDAVAATYYKVISKEGASDHAPVITEFLIK